MQYSMNDHINQPNKKNSGKRYFEIGIEKSENKHKDTDVKPTVTGHDKKWLLCT